MSKRTTMCVAGAALLLAALVAAPLVRHGERVQYLTSKVERGEIKDAVDATGVVNAVVSGRVGARASARPPSPTATSTPRVQRAAVSAGSARAFLGGAGKKPRPTS